MKQKMRKLLSVMLTIILTIGVLPADGLSVGVTKVLAADTVSAGTYELNLKTYVDALITAGTAGEDAKFSDKGISSIAIPNIEDSNYAITVELAQNLKSKTGKGICNVKNNEKNILTFKIPQSFKADVTMTTNSDTKPEIRDAAGILKSTKVGMVCSATELTEGTYTITSNDADKTYNVENLKIVLTVNAAPVVYAATASLSEKTLKVNSTGTFPDGSKLTYYYLSSNVTPAADHSDMTSENELPVLETTVSQADAHEDVLNTGKLTFKESGSSYNIFVKYGANYKDAGTITWTSDVTPWAQVTPPTITLTKEAEKSEVTINYTMVVGEKGAETVEIELIDSTGAAQTLKEADSEVGVKKTITTEDTAYQGSGSLTAALTKTGTYKATITAVRSTETENKTATASVDFVLPLGTASVTAVPGDASVDVSWKEIAEATSYDIIVSQNGSDFRTIKDITDTKYTVKELANDTKYGFKVVTNRSTTTTDNKTTSSEVTATPKAPEEGVEWLIANELEVQTLSSDLVYPENSIYTVLNGVKIESMEAVTATDETVFTKRFNTTGAAAKDDAGNFKVPVTAKGVKLVLTEFSNITVYCRSGGSDERVLRLVDESGKVVKEFAAVANTSNVEPSAALELEAGTYYLASTKSGIHIFGIKTRKGPAPRKAWSEVNAPVINSVVRDDEGNLVVDYTAAFGTNGADTGRVFMFQDGFEVSSFVAASEGKATFTPTTNGEFTFKVILSRDGEADKESEVYTFSDYILPPATPAITWIQNLGNGSVYVDWNNVSASKGCDVSYALAGSDSYTTVATGNTKGNLVINGLTAGSEYIIKVQANDEISGSSAYTRNVTVGNPVQEWFVDDIGSATKGEITVNGTKINVASYSSAYPVSQNPVEDITNTSLDLLIQLPRGNTNGKIADSEEGLQIYYTRINPNTENFKLTATFELSDTTEKVDNQSGFGIYALDIAGLGTKDAKYMNSVAVGNFKMLRDGATKYHSNGVRVVTGYTTYDPTSTAGTGRVLDNTNYFSSQSSDDALVSGVTYTYTLEKTSTGFTASMEGASESITIPDVTKIMTQEDGSIVLAIAAARCDAHITNIKFEKTAGSVEGVDVVEIITPAVKVYSSKIAATKDYEFIANANVPGTITIYKNGEEIGTAVVDDSTAAKLPVTLWNAGDNNTITYTFTPDKATANLSSYDAISGSHTVLWSIHGVQNQVVYVSSTAPLNGVGTKADPADLQVALNNAQPGQTIVMLDGTYSPSADLIIPRNISGTADKMITLVPENTGKVKVNGANLTSSSSLITVVGSYWKIYGIEFCNTSAKGVSVAGNNNIIEMCTIHDTGNSGLQISRYNEEPNDKQLWPSNNLIKNCESYNNCDAGRNDADGFAAKLTCGEGNVFYGCISHHNIDDGWDLYAKSTTGEIGAVTVENCIAYSNGFLLEDDAKVAAGETVDFGEGNGFKLGGENMYGGHKLINSVSFNNAGKGITSNSCPDCQVINCTAYNNSLKGGAYNVSLYTKSDNKKAWVLKGMLSVATNGKTNGELGSSNGVIYSLRSATNYLYDGNGSFNNQGVEATEDWFESVDVSVVPTRNEDGTINMHGLLVLKSTAPTDTGARINTSSAATSVKPTISTTETVTASELVKASVSDVIPESVLTDAVKKALGVSSVQELVKYMEKAILTSSEAKAKLADIPEANTKVVDIEVVVSFDGGKTWVKATQENFPTSGLDVLIPYPAGTNKDNFDFVISHLATMNVNGMKAGDIEYLAPVKTADGLKVHITSASPFAIGWKAISTTPATTSTTSPKTADHMPLIPISLVMGVCLLGMGAIMAEDKKRKNAR